MQIELSKSFSLLVASLATGISVDYSYAQDRDYSIGLRFNQVIQEFGITAVDRLYPLKPKNPI